MSNSMGFGDFSRAALGDAPKGAQQMKSMVPDSASPAQQFSRTFLYQSYFDSTLLSTALLEQLPNDSIVASTYKEEQVSGYAVGLHPSSQTAVSVQFKVGGQPTSSQALTLKPGQIIRPFGLSPGQRSGAFSAIAWGLPFGWLGGGTATLVVFQTPDADVLWPGNPDIIFHRQRMQIVSSAALPANAPKNWPLRFPWTQAVQGASSIIQKGSAVTAIVPTKTILRLRLANLAAPADMRLIFQGTQDFDLNAAGSVVLTPCPAVDVTWGTWASAGAGNLGTQHQLQSLTDLGYTFGADDGGVVLSSASAELIDQYVDVTRYGRLG